VEIEDHLVDEGIPRRRARKLWLASCTKGKPTTKGWESMTNLEERAAVERFLEQTDEDSFNALFRGFSPELVAFFRRRGHDRGIAEDLTQEVMLTVYRKAAQLRDQNLFRSWLFRVARNAACRHFAQMSRQVPTVDLADVTESLPTRNYATFGPHWEFRNWMELLDATERETMTLRFVEEWEYHEIAAAQGIPIGTVQWRVFNSKKKLATHLGPVGEIHGRAA
jgi:RNA polymerase sigma factor (sigma-70 family)